jgi:hypothetical protein
MRLLARHLSSRARFCSVQNYGINTMISGRLKGPGCDARSRCSHVFCHLPSVSQTCSYLRANPAARLACARLRMRAAFTCVSVFALDVHVRLARLHDREGTASHGGVCPRCQMWHPWYTTPRLGMPSSTLSASLVMLA